MAQNRFCRTPLLCSWLPCRRRQQHRRGEERRAGLLPPAKPVLVALCPSHGSRAGGSRDRLQSGTHLALQLSTGRDEVQSSSSAHRGALSSQISAGLWAGPPPVIQNTVCKTSWPVLQNKSWTQRADHRSISSNTAGGRDVVHPSDRSLAFPKSLPERSPPLCCMLTGKALDVNCQCDSKDVLFTLFFPFFFLCLPQSASPAFLCVTVTSVKPVTSCIYSGWMQKRKQVLQMLP